MHSLTDEELSVLAGDHFAIRSQPRAVRKEVASLDAIIGTPARRLIATAPKATHYQVHPVPEYDLKEGQIRHHRILSVRGDLTGDQLSTFRSLVLQSKHHMPADKRHIASNPSVAIRVHGAITHAILIDPIQNTWHIRVNGGAFGPDSTFAVIQSEVHQFLGTLAPDE
jgi:hypothetical protein